MYIVQCHNLRNLGKYMVSVKITYNYLCQAKIFGNTEHQCKERKSDGLGDGCVGVCVCEPLNCVQLFVTAWTIAFQGPISMEFTRQENWSGLPFSSPGKVMDILL